MKPLHLKFAVLTTFIFTLLLFAYSCNSGKTTSDNSLPRTTPAKAGLSSQAIENFLTAMDDKDVELHSFMLVKDGNVVSEEWFGDQGPDVPHEMFSVSKTVTSIGVGFAVQEGLVSVDDKVISFFPNKLPETVSDNLQALTIKNLLTMSVGQDADVANRISSGDLDWVVHFLSLPIENVPGSVFAYNNMAAYMLSAIIQQVTGQKLLDFLEPRLFHPLGIEGVYSRESPQGINTGGWGKFLKTEDMAKIGILLLNEGKWKGEQLLSAQWVKDMSSVQIDTPNEPNNDWCQGYGYQMWRCSPEGVFRADGAYGQFIIVMPKQNSVVVMTCKDGNMQEMLNNVWTYLLPEL